MKNTKMEYPISLDTALQIVGSLRIKTSKKISAETNPEKREMLIQELDMYMLEEDLLYSSNPLEKLSVMDKVVRLYSPILKEYNGTIVTG